MPLQDHNSDRPDPNAVYFSYMSAMLGIASFFFYSIITGPVALGMGLWAKKKGAKGFAMYLGIVTGAISTVLCLILLFLPQNAA